MVVVVVVFVVGLIINVIGVLQFIHKLRSLLQTPQHALSSEDVNTIFFKIINLHLMHKEFVCDLESALSDQPDAYDIVSGPAFCKLVSVFFSHCSAGRWLLGITDC